MAVKICECIGIFIKERMKKMYEKIPTAGMSNKEWLTLRKTGIGGSDAGSICGMDPHGKRMSIQNAQIYDLKF